MKTLIKLRIKQKLSIGDIAQVLQIPYPTYYLYEKTGRVRSTAHLLKIKKYLDKHKKKFKLEDFA